MQQAVTSGLTSLLSNDGTPIRPKKKKAMRDKMAQWLELEEWPFGWVKKRMARLMVSTPTF